MTRIKKYSVLTLYLVVILGFGVNTYGQSIEESAAGDLPLPSTLIAKHIEAIGGEEAIRAHTTQTIEGKLLIKAMGIEGDLQVFAEAPNKSKNIIQLGQFGSSRSGYNGTIGWNIDPMSGTRILEGEALSQMIERSEFHGNDLNLGKNAIKKETIETVTFDNAEQYKVLLVDANGEESYLYFSKETGLLSGIDGMELGMAGKVPTQTRLENYVETDGVKTARKITSIQNGGETIIEIDSISYENLPENTFELPAEIQALVNK